LPSSNGTAYSIFYFIVDVSFFLGIVGLYGARKGKIFRWNTVGFVLAFLGSVLLIGHDVVGALETVYPLAALLLAVGAAVLAVRMRVTRNLQGWISSLFVLSTVTGIAGSFTKGSSVPFIISGVAFGIAFAGMGLAVYRYETA
jgi:uncharacterized membrane protein (UPF0136 family)